jgi:hypothetical protein
MYNLFGDSSKATRRKCLVHQKCAKKNKCKYYKYNAKSTKHQITRKKYLDIIRKNFDLDTMKFFGKRRGTIHVLAPDATKEVVFTHVPEKSRYCSFCSQYSKKCRKFKGVKTLGRQLYCSFCSNYYERCSKLKRVVWRPVKV